MGGPQALLGWLVGAVLAVCDGMVWAELASAIPSSGGTFEYLKVAYAKTPLGRLLPFLFIWQFILSGPLEIATGNIGFAQYATYLVPLDPDSVEWFIRITAVVVGMITVLLLYRKIESVGKLMVVLWAGVVAAIVAILVSGLCHFNFKAVTDFPPDAFRFSSKFFFGLGMAMSFAMYDFLGYYSVCYIGDEVRNPSRTIPRSILIAVLTIGVVYIVMNLSIISVVPWREAIQSKYIACDFMERLFGRMGGLSIAVLICWCALASVFALLLGYSRIPYAAARDGFFFSAFGRLHPRGDFPHVSLLVLGLVSAVASLFPLDAVINAMMCTRILVQFVAQIAAVTLMRRLGERPGGFRMALYPVPSVIALVGWLFIFGASDPLYLLGASGALVLGVVAYVAWSRYKDSLPPQCQPGEPDSSRPLGEMDV